MPQWLALSPALSGDTKASPERGILTPSTGVSFQVGGQQLLGQTPLEWDRSHGMGQIPLVMSRGLNQSPRGWAEDAAYLHSRDVGPLRWETLWVQGAGITGI